MFIHFSSKGQNERQIARPTTIHHSSLNSPISSVETDFDTDSKSGSDRSTQDSTFQPLDDQHPRRRSTALEAQVCVLDTGSTPRGEGSGEGQMGRERGSESSGRMGKEHTGYEGGGSRTSGEMIYYVGPDGWIFYPDSSGHSKEEIRWKENFADLRHTYSRVVSEHGQANAVECLGESLAEDASFWDAFPDLSRCFNCGNVNHSFRSCPDSLNHELIALSQSLYQFFKESGGGQPPRFHEVEEWKRQRLRWTEEFVPGEIRGTRLREALGLHDEDGYELSDDLLWLHSIMEVGFPRGWTGSVDPRELVRNRILDGLDAGDKYDESTIDFIVFGEGEEERIQLRCAESLDGTRSSSENRKNPVNKMKIGDNPTPSTLNSRSPSPYALKKTELHRWANYRTTLFLSELLPIYSPPKPPPEATEIQHPSKAPPQTITRPAATSELPLIIHCSQCANSSKFQPLRKDFPHPWRYPGAFNAFGPVDWSELYAEAHAEREALQCICSCHSTPSSFPFPHYSNDGEVVDSDEEGQDTDMEFSD